MNICRSKLHIHQVLAVAGLSIGVLVPLPAIASVLDPADYRKLVLVPVLVSFSGLFILSSIALFRGHNWGRALLSTLFHLPIIGLALLTVLFIREILPKHNIPALIGGIGVFAVLAIPLGTLIALLGSQKLREELNATKSSPKQLEATGVPPAPQP